MSEQEQGLPKAKSPFRFVTQVNLNMITPRRAINLTELLNNLKEVPGSVIYYHTHRFLKQHQFLSPEPPNDFAFWVAGSLQDDLLAERLASIDTVRFHSLRDLRDKIVQTIEQHVAARGPGRQAPPEEEFRFMQSMSFVLPTPYEARDLREFVESLAKVSINSLYNHMFDAKIRLSGSVNDFSEWFENELGEHELAKAVSRMDPYTQTLEGLRSRIIVLVEKRIKEVKRVAYK